MAIWHGETGRKNTGGMITLSRKKKLKELGSKPTFTQIGKEKIFSYKTKSSSIKVRVVQAEFANVLDPATKTTKKAKIIDIVENSANQHYIRRKVINKGAIIKTDLGDARITSRPSQDGVVNAVLVKKTN